MLPRFRLRTLLAIFTLASILLVAVQAAWMRVTGPIIPESTLAKLRGGMTVDEVIEILGEPDEYEPSKPSWGTGFLYHHPLGRGNLYIHCEWLTGKGNNGDSIPTPRLSTIHDDNSRYSKKYGRRSWTLDPESLEVD